MNKPLLKVENLSVFFPGQNANQAVPAIKNINLSLNKGETLGIIGESGSGKSVTLLSLMGLINVEPGIVSGSIELKTDNDCINLLQDIEQYITIKESQPQLSQQARWNRQREKLYKSIRGKEISMIFQNPKLAFNPYYSIGSQINEMIRLHTEVKDKQTAKERAIEWLSRVKMEAPAMRYNNNPYGLSGGMCQRAMIAMALASQPSLLIADEPTTGLDATIQSNIVDLLSEIRCETGVSMIVVSHDFNVMRQLTDRIIVYYKGRIIEQGKTETIFNADRENIHPYTRRLLDANLQGFIDSSSTPYIDNTTKNGCDFYEYCPVKDSSITELCQNNTPELLSVDTDHHIRCWRYQDE